ncbi:hypothetical protein [Nocardioides sp.]|uniref:hypothetical protein n=1 Tax=Nocardioides sp. TaxID=35761 RepID=UPI003D1198AC
MRLPTYRRDTAKLRASAGPSDPTTWLPVMTMPDGTTIEMPLTSPDGGARGRHCYRVCRAGARVEFATLNEIAAFVLEAVDAQRRDEQSTRSPGQQ